MASGKYQTYSQRLLNWLFNAGVFAQPTNLYLALFSVTPTVSTTGTEAASGVGGYTRVTVACTTANWPTISGTTTTMTSGAAFTFPVGTGAGYSSGINMVGAGIFDSLTVGTLLLFGDLTVAKPILSGDTPSMAAGALTIQEL